ncbi:MAG: FAD-dependent oxidoreductase [Planctomycetota bacterium]
MTTQAGTGRRAFVLGGGVAGLTAAFGLRDAGFAVTLLESRGWLGGRAFSSPEKGGARLLDNGPHVMLGCYTAMRALLRRLGTENGFQQDERLAMAYRHDGGRVLQLALSRWPVPLAMPWALLRLPVPFGARVRAFLGMASSLLRAPATWTLADWFARRRQHGVPDAMLWRPLCRAIMNCEPEEAEAEGFLATLREAFLGRASRAAFWLPKAPWSELIDRPARAALPAAGIDLRLGARIAALPVGSDRIEAIGLADGERLGLGPDDLVVTALPWFALGALLPDIVPKARELRAAPIVSAYVTMPENEPPLPDDGPVTALVDGAPFHFVLRRPGDDPRHVAMLSGGDRSFDGQTVAAIVERARAQLARWYPGSRMANAQVVVRKESLATFVPACGSRVLRPAPGRVAGGPANLRLCGDWTDTGFPATLEGACRSALTMLREFAR